MIYLYWKIITFHKRTTIDLYLFKYFIKHTLLGSKTFLELSPAPGLEQNVSSEPDPAGAV